jgi:hypothetical protein
MTTGHCHVWAGNRALRRTARLSERERVVSNLWTGQPASPFESGMFTMYREAQLDFEQDEEYRYLAVAALAALAAVPAFSRRSDPARQETEAMTEYPPATWLPNERCRDHVSSVSLPALRAMAGMTTEDTDED